MSNAWGQSWGDSWGDSWGAGVTPVAPTAAFSGTPRTGNVPLAVAFTDQSAGSPTSWVWNFGDGATSTEQNPAHTYARPGVWTVSLTATNASGSNTATKADYITVTNVVPQPYFGSGGGGGGPLLRHPTKRRKEEEETEPVEVAEDADGQYEEDAVQATLLVALMDEF